MTDFLGRVKGLSLEIVVPRRRGIEPRKFAIKLVDNVRSNHHEKRHGHVTSRSNHHKKDHVSIVIP